MQTTQGKSSLSKLLSRLTVFILSGFIVAISVYIVVTYGQEQNQPDKPKTEHANYRAIKGLSSVENPPHPTPENFTPFRVLNEMPPITNIVSLPEDDHKLRVDDEELVLGVVVQGEARAYPLNMMTNPDREIFNDMLGGIPIAATW